MSVKQCVRFESGGFALFGVSGSWVGKCSAWYDADGSLLDAEQIRPNGASYPVRHDGPMWASLQRIGKGYIPNPKA